MRALYVATAIVATLPAIARTQTATWTVDLARPALIIGADADETTQLFANVVGATRLPDGNILVGDHAAFSLHLFGRDGKRLKTFGRKGEGPGEFGYLARFLRCGDSVVTYDIQNGDRVSVFGIDGVFARAFRFSSPEPGSPPYSGGTACNRRLQFAHHGWGLGAAPPQRGVHTPSVPFWIGSPSGSVEVVFDTLPGSERYAHMNGTRVVGSGPLPFGKQPRVAIASDRVYVGRGAAFEILVYDLTGKPLPPIVKRDAVAAPVTPADIATEKEKRLAALTPNWIAQFEREFPTIPFPKTFPFYDRLVLDSDENLWVQDYPRAQSRTVNWTVFAKSGAQLAVTALPRDLEVLEIGRDYVLGRYIDPDEGIPHVRMYTLKR